MQNISDTIIACSSPLGRGAISLVRISGPDLTFLSQELKINNLFNKKTIVKEIQLKHDFKEKCVLTFFKSPNSFTGEDVLEVSCHGNPLIVELIIDFFVDLGCRRAGPGEFSLRGFINGKLSYLEAEAIDDLINSENELQLNASARSLAGEFEKKIDSLIDELLKLRVYLESNIDFSDEEIIKDFERFKKDLKDFNNKINEFIRDSDASRYLIEGVRVVITGPPNVGKSTLMNILCDENASIISEISGTTRDIIQRSVKIDNLSFLLHDTAGITNASQDPIEKEGVFLAQELLSNCDLIIEVVDVFSGNYSCDYDKPVIRLENKSDLSDDLNKKKINTSFLKNSGIEELKVKMIEKLNLPNSLDQITFSARSRHTKLLKMAKEELSEALKLDSEDSLELIADNLRYASNLLGEIKSPYTSDELLGEIFSSFCIGK